MTINEVPTFRADQMPYGGVKDSGNTREGPAWAVREMTEERLVVVAALRSPRWRRSSGGYPQRRCDCSTASPPHPPRATSGASGARCCSSGGAPARPRGLTLEMYRRDHFNEQLVVERCAELVAIEARVSEIDALLAAARGLRRRQRAICACGAPILIGARYCPSCGRALDDVRREGAGGGLGGDRDDRGHVPAVRRSRRALQEYCLECGLRLPGRDALGPPPTETRTSAAACSRSLASRCRRRCAHRRRRHGTSGAEAILTATGGSVTMTRRRHVAHARRLAARPRAGGRSCSPRSRRRRAATGGRRARTACARARPPPDRRLDSAQSRACAPATGSTFTGVYDSRGGGDQLAPPRAVVRQGRSRPPLLQLKPRCQSRHNDCDRVCNTAANPVHSPLAGDPPRFSSPSVSPLRGERDDRMDDTSRNCSPACISTRERSIARSRI